MKVLSLFDGMSCGQIALDQLGIKNEYFASEIDKFSIKVTQANYPNTTQLGDVSKVSKECDLLLAGSPCFVKDTEIICGDKIKPINTVKVGDRVLTHSNRYRKVLRVGQSKKQIYVLTAQGGTPIETTENHPFYIRTKGKKRIKTKTGAGKKYDSSFSAPRWEKVKNIKKGDYVGTPIINTSKNPLKLTEDECFVLGLYIGDGHTRKDYRTSENRPNDRHWQLILSIGSHQAEDLSKIINLHHSAYPHTKSVIRFVFSSKRLVRVAEEHCGIGSENKHFGKTLLDLPKNLLKRVIEGYLFADGCYRKNTYKATTISKKLVESISLAVAKVYRTTTSIIFTKRPPKTIIEGRTVNQKNTWTVSFKSFHPKGSRAWVIDNIIWNPVKNIIKNKGKADVFNIEVEQDNSYVANNRIVHNCQGFSVSGKQLNFTDPRSKLFFEFVRIKNESKPKYFLLENVKMKKEWQDVISTYLGCEPIEINSSLVSGQNRRRLYWTNIPTKLPIDKNISFKDILEDGVDDKYYVSEKQKARLDKGNLTTCGGICFKLPGQELAKSPCLMARDYKGIPGRQLFPIAIDKELRKLTPVEYERLQTVPDNYTAAVSDTQRYKMLGNGWTVETIKHILEAIK